MTWTDEAFDSRDLALGDYDGDGRLDILLGNSPGSALFKNNADGSWTKVTGIGLATSSQAIVGAVAFADIDQDGDLDAFVGIGGGAQADAAADELYRNNGYDRRGANAPATLLPGAPSPWRTLF